MSRYQYYLWSSNNDNMTSDTLRKLLDLNKMNMSEPEVWEMVVDWARKEAESRGLDGNSAETKRALIEEEGLLSRVRFLTMSEPHLNNLLPVLSKQEVSQKKLAKYYGVLSP